MGECAKWRESERKTCHDIMAECRCRAGTGSESQESFFFFFIATDRLWKEREGGVGVRRGKEG